ncbi:hypothetical protein ACFQU7_08155 [Pseudoroseomonas wenyumeiae]
MRLPVPVLVGLRRLGLERAGDVLRQPARRWPAASARPGAAAGPDAGRGRHPFRSLRPPPEFQVVREMMEPLITRGGIDAALSRMLPALCVQLGDAGRGVLRLVLRAHRGDGTVQEAMLGLGLPSRDPAHLHRLLESRLEALEPRFGFERLDLLAERTEPLAALQSGMVAGATPAADAAALAQLIDRLGQRLPVWRLAPRASHWPERAAMKVAPSPASTRPRAGPPAPPAAPAAAAGADRGDRGAAGCAAAPHPLARQLDRHPRRRGAGAFRAGMVARPPGPPGARLLPRGMHGRHAALGLPRRAAAGLAALVPAWRLCVRRGHGFRRTGRHVQLHLPRRGLASA